MREGYWKMGILVIVLLVIIIGAIWMAWGDTSPNGSGSNDL